MEATPLKSLIGAARLERKTRGSAAVEPLIRANAIPVLGEAPVKNSGGGSLWPSKVGSDF
jgi:hypothetical protein